MGGEEMIEEDDNMNYNCICAVCGDNYIGHKRSHICDKCKIVCSCDLRLGGYIDQKGHEN